MTKEDSGDYVLYTAYEALQAENERLTKDAEIHRKTLTGQFEINRKAWAQNTALTSALEVAEGALKDAIDKAVSGHWNDLEAVLTNALDQIAKIKETI